MKVTYIGRRITTKHKLGYFFLRNEGEKSGTEFGRLQQKFRMEIGEEFDYNEDGQDFTPLHTTATDEDIVRFTTESMRCELEHRLKNRKKPELISTRIKEIIREVIALDMTAWERSQIAHQIYKAITDGVAIEQKQKPAPAKKKGAKKK